MLCLCELFNTILTRSRETS